MDFQLSGQVAVVAGGARGIGRAIAEAFAAEGAHVALLDRDAEVENTARAVGERRPVRVLPLTADVVDYAAVRRAAASARRWWRGRGREARRGSRTPDAATARRAGRHPIARG